MDCGLATLSRLGMTEKNLRTRQNKKDQLALAQCVIFCDRPGSDDLGGLGAEESETERTGPTQCPLFPG
jgi:hypothetical protein